MLSTDNKASWKKWISLCIATMVIEVVLLIFADNGVLISLLGDFIARREMISKIILSQSLAIFIIPIVTYPFIIMKKEESVNVWLYEIPFAIIGSFIIANVQIIILRDFQGIGHEWNYGDFTNWNYLNMYSIDRLYDTNYPPLAVLIYCFFKLFIPVHSDWHNSFRYINFLIIVVSIFSIYWLVECYIDGIKNKKFIAFSALITGPMLFAIQRENIILFAFIFTLIFYFFKDSKKKSLRIISYISLAIAANIKIYPAIYGALLLKQKRFKGALCSFLIGSVLFFLPSLVIFFIEGRTIFDQLFSFWNHVKGLQGTGEVYTISFWTMANKFCILLGLTDKWQFDIMVLLIQIIMFLLCLIITLWSEDEFDTLIMLSLLVACVPQISYWYTLVFLTLPIVYYLKENVSRGNEVMKNIQLITIMLVLIPVYENPILGINKYLRLVSLLLITSFHFLYKTCISKNTVK